MKMRCYRTTGHDYPTYGAVGIEVSDEWLGVGGFERFFFDMGVKPSPSHSMDRIDNSKGYGWFDGVLNCRWATPKEQSQNSSKPVYFTAFGVTMNTTEWSNATGISRRAILYRNRTLGWGDADCVLTPPGSSGHRRSSV